jgi:hypothetical protein
LKDYFKRCGSEAVRWFRATRPGWISLGLVLIVSIIAYKLPGELTSRVRWTGTTFEFLGVTAVLVGVERARRSFGRPSIIKGLIVALAEFKYIFWRRPTTNVSISAGIGLSVGVAMGVPVIRTARTVEERLTSLEQESTETQSKIGKLESKVDQQKRELEAQIASETAQRKANDEQVKMRLEEGLIGDNNLEIAGVAFVCLGLLLACTRFRRHRVRCFDGTGGV